MSDVCLRLIACLAILLGFALETCEAQRHRHVQTLKDKQLEKVVQLCTSPDGKHLHAVSYRPGHLLGFEINQESGHLTKTSTVLKYQMVSLDVSKDQTRVVGASLMEDGKVTLYQRNPETGALQELHELYSEFVPELRRSIAVKFSPDGKFVFVACRTERFTILRIENDKLVLHQSLEGIDGCINNSQFVTCDRSGKNIFVSSRVAGTISVFGKNEDDTFELRSYIKDNTLAASLLDGVHGLAVSPDGKHLYATSGRFGGEHAVSGFTIHEDSTLSKLCEWENGIELEGFEGGHHIAVSPDGWFVFATGAKSQNVACFERDRETGKLEFLEYLSADGSAQFGMTAGIAFSLDNQFVYIAGESDAKIFAFQRQGARR